MLAGIDGFSRRKTQLFNSAYQEVGYSNTFDVFQRLCC